MADLDKLKSYLSHILKYLLGDIDHLKERGVTASFPYLYLSFAGIDFLGGLQYGFERGISRKRSSWFISHWMSKINSRYRISDPNDSKSQASYLYTFARSGLVHMACVQQSVVVSTDPELQKHHLGYSNADTTRVFIHPVIFADEFRKAADLFLNDLYSDEEKVRNALKHVEAHFDESSADEKQFSVASLFHDLDRENLRIAESAATSSAQNLSRLGTQGPQKI